MQQVEQLMRENKSKLEKKLESLKFSKEEITNNIEYLNLNISELQEKLDLMKPDLVELRKKRENYHMWLLQRGENEDKIQQVIDPVKRENINDISIDSQESHKIRSSLSMSDIERAQNSTLVAPSLSDTSKLSSSSDMNEYSYQISYDDSSAANSLNWFKPDLNRAQAEEILKSRPDGTYLVRNGSNGNSKYVISVVAREQIVHMMIDEMNRKYYLKLNTETKRSKIKGNSLLSPSFIRSRSSSHSSNSSLTEAIAKPLLSSISSIDSNVSRSSSIPGQVDSTSNLTTEKVMFNTLTEVIVYYSNYTLRPSNSSTEIRLIYPAFYENK